MGPQATIDAVQTERRRLSEGVADRRPLGARLDAARARMQRAEQRLARSDLALNEARQRREHAAGEAAAAHAHLRELEIAVAEAAGPPQEVTKAFGAVRETLNAAPGADSERVSAALEALAVAIGIRDDDQIPVEPCAGHFQEDELGPLDGVPGDAHSGDPDPRAQRAGARPRAEEGNQIPGHSAEESGHVGSRGRQRAHSQPYRPGADAGRDRERSPRRTALQSSRRSAW